MEARERSRLDALGLEIQAKRRRWALYTSLLLKDARLGSARAGERRREPGFNPMIVKTQVAGSGSRNRPPPAAACRPQVRTSNAPMVELGLDVGHAHGRCAVGSGGGTGELRRRVGRDRLDIAVTSRRLRRKVVSGWIAAVRAGKITRRERRNIFVDAFSRRRKVA